MTETILGRVSGGQDLSGDEIRQAIHQIMDGQWSPQEIGLLLVALREGRDG